MDFEILRQYEGKGTFVFNLDEPIEQEAEFVLRFYSNSKMDIETEFLMTKRNSPILNMQVNGGSLIESNLNGIIIDENEEIGTISIEKLAINESTFSANQGEPVKLKASMICYSPVDIVYSDEKSVEAEIHYGLTNFVFSGCEYSIIGKSRIVDKFNASVDNLNILFKKVENYNEIKTRLTAKKGCLVTSEAIVSTAIDNVDASRNTIFDIVMLLSLATRNYVSPIYEDYFYNGEIIRTVLNPVLTHNYKGSENLIDINTSNPCSIKDFLETTYDKYQESKDVLGLNATISLYLVSGFTVYTETKFILMFIAIESLLQNIESYLETIGKPIIPSLQKRTESKLKIALKSEGVDLDDTKIKSIASSVGYQHTTFDDKLNALIKEYGVTCSSEERELMSIRNKVVHNAKFPNEINSRVIEPYAEYTRLVHFIDRILLTILNYAGKPFLNIHDKYKETIL